MIIGYVHLNFSQIVETEVFTDELLITKNVVETDSNSLKVNIIILYSNNECLLKVNIIILYSNNECLLALTRAIVLQSNSSTEY